MLWLPAVQPDNYWSSHSKVLAIQFFTRLCRAQNKLWRVTLQFHRDLSAQPFALFFSLHCIDVAVWKRNKVRSGLFRVFGVSQVKRGFKSKMRFVKMLKLSSLVCKSP